MFHYVKKLKYGKRWEVNEPLRMKEGMMVAWNQNVEIKQMRKTNFYIGVHVENETEVVIFWVIFVYASLDARERQG